MTESPGIEKKWRPPLALIAMGVLLAVLALPVGIVIAFRALDNTASRMGPIEAAALLLALALTLVIALVFARTITGPIEALVARAHDIGRGGRAAIRPLEKHGTREIAVLSQSFLDLAARLVDRSEHVQSFAAHVCHELKSPLTSIKGAAELLREAEGSEHPIATGDRQRFLDHIIADTERLAALLDRLRELARAERIWAGGSSTIGAATAQLQARFSRLSIDLSGAGATTVAIPAETLLIVLSHLADNALQHGATALLLDTRLEGGTVSLIVADDGEGISDGNRELVFQPFFTTRRETGGTGMGLEIARTMLSAHGGTIALAPSVRGASFRITLPAG